MRNSIIAFCLLIASCLFAETPEFHLKGAKKTYGPYAFKHGVKFKIGKRSFKLAVDASKTPAEFFVKRKKKNFGPFKFQDGETIKLNKRSFTLIAPKGAGGGNTGGVRSSDKPDKPDIPNKPDKPDEPGMKATQSSTAPRGDYDVIGKSRNRIQALQPKISPNSLKDMAKEHNIKTDNKDWALE